MVNARNATLSQRPKALNAVGMGRPINIDLSTMLNSPMLVPGIGNSIVARELVSVDDSSSSHVFANKRHDSGTFDIGDDRCGNFAMPLDNTDYGSLAFCPTASLASPNPAEIRFVNFDLAVKGNSIFTEQCPDLFEHSPRCFVGDTSYPLEFHSRMSRTCSGYPKHSIKPSPKRRSRLVEDSTRSRVDLMPTVIALVARSVLNPVVLSYLVANRAIDAIRKSVVFKPLKASIVIRELMLKLCQCVLLKLCLDLVSHFRIPLIHVVYHKSYVLSRDTYLIFILDKYSRGDIGT
jgi:hypothetical protein